MAFTTGQDRCVTFRTRFAPSPTGPLHLGHAYSACLAHDMAREAGGRFHLRIDDLDRARSRPEWEARIKDDLAWLGLSWERDVWRQSDRLTRYRQALRQLWDAGLLYPCTLTRAEIRAVANAPQEGAEGPDGLIYPGTHRPEMPPKGEMPTTALRLDTARAEAAAGPLSYVETGTNPGTNPDIIQIQNLFQSAGDVALARKDMGASYHLSVVCDDADQQITHVIRGEDLAPATGIHVLLQNLLGLPTPTYHHHRLIRDDTGKRLAKRDDARAIATYRAEGLTPRDIKTML
ncbi:MAG: tRNA glutamyl-Q(34) synthetase GluQRS [Pseudomonadota bacterium]